MSIILLPLKLRAPIVFFLLYINFKIASTFDSNSTNKNKIQITWFLSLKISLSCFFAEA